MNDDTPRVPSQATRWTALGAGGGAVLAMSMDTWGPAGPWAFIALGLALVSVVAISVLLFTAKRHERHWVQTDERARRGEQTVDALQREIDRHTQLEQELMLAFSDDEQSGPRDWYQDSRAVTLPRECMPQWRTLH